MKTPTPAGLTPRESKGCFKSYPKLNSFVWTPRGLPGIVWGIEANLVRVKYIGYYTFTHPEFGNYPLKSLKPLTRARAWKLAPRFEGHDC